MAKNRQWILTRRPVGDIRDGDLVWREDRGARHALAFESRTRSRKPGRAR